MYAGLRWQPAWTGLSNQGADRGQEVNVPLACGYATHVRERSLEVSPM